MPDIVRTIQPFYYAANSLNVNANLTERVFGAAAELVAEHVGGIALGKVQPQNLRHQYDYDTKTIRTDAVELGSAPHVALLSSVGFLPQSGGKSSVGGRCYDSRLCGPGRTRVFVWYDEAREGKNSDYAIAIATATHEFGHSFGITSHCPDTECVMSDSTIPTREWAEALLSSAAFCGDCTETLEAFRPEPPRSLPAAKPLFVSPYTAPRSVLYPWWLPTAS